MKHGISIVIAFAIALAGLGQSPSGEWSNK